MLKLLKMCFRSIILICVLIFVTDGQQDIKNCGMRRGPRNRIFGGIRSARNGILKEMEKGYTFLRFYLIQTGLGL